jgi:hypothetical protein
MASLLKCLIIEIEKRPLEAFAFSLNDRRISERMIQFISKDSSMKLHFILNKVIIKKMKHIVCKCSFTTTSTHFLPFSSCAVIVVRCTFRRHLPLSQWDHIQAANGTRHR